MRLHHVDVVVPPGRTEAVAPFYEAPAAGATADPEGGAVELVEAAGPFRLA